MASVNDRAREDPRKAGSARLGVAILLTFTQLAVGPVPAVSAETSTNSLTTQPGKPSDGTFDEEGVSKQDRDEVLGNEWQANGDVAHVVLADSDRIDVLSARSADGYEWSPTASLTLPETDTDLWISNSCVTASGRYLALVFAPRAITNSDVGMAAGAAAAILDFETGQWTTVDGGYTIAYFNPGCGTGDTVALTTYAEDGSGSSVVVVDAATGSVRTKTKFDGQATSAVADEDGSVYAATSEGVVSVTLEGEVATLRRTTGTPYNFVLDDDGRLGFLVPDGDNTSVYLGQPTALSKSKPIASGPLTGTEIQRSAAGGVYLLGATSPAKGVPNVEFLPDARPGAVISSTGALVINTIKPAGLARADDQVDEDRANIAIDVTVTATGHSVDFTLDPGVTSASTGRSTNYDDAPVVRTDSGDSRGVTETQPIAGVVARSVLAAGEPHQPSEAERVCAVPRNDPANQAYQPKPRQVEWAVDRAVSGQLTETRPANWRGLGMSSYSAQGLFPRVTLAGGGSIPPQVVLAVLMQESNLWQASRYTLPGNTGNPLIGDYYGNRDYPWEVRFASADCGYGVGQITDGMRLAGMERLGETALPYNQQRAIALDYTANIAMSVRMLGQKWNQLASSGITINDGSSKYIENWFGAVWAYNTGIQPSAAFGNPGCTPGPTCTGTSGTWGLGWSNNPINPIFNPARTPFLQNSAADAATPQQWPYPEKIMGFAAWGLELVQTQWADPDTRTYQTDTAHSYRLAQWLDTDNMAGEVNRATVRPPRELFCDMARNLCDPATTSACTLSSMECWWHGNATWKTDCSNFCGYGFERFNSSYATEADSMLPSLPPITLRSSFLPNCEAAPTGWLVIDDTKQPSARNAADCTTRQTTGSFEFTFPYADSSGSYPAKIDVHQQGGGYNGHFYFSHMRKASAGANANNRLAVTGKWTLGQSLDQWTRVWVHLPSYAAWTPQAGYTVSYGPGQSQKRYLPQRRYANEWVSLGVFHVNGTPSVSLSNLVTDVDPSDPRGADIDDLAWDAVAFEPLSAKPADFVVGLGDSYSSGEGAGSYEPWSDNNGSSSELRNRCHQSANAWIRKTTIPGRTQTIGALESARSKDLDFHFLACSGAESEDLLPYHTVSGIAPTNGAGETGRYGRNGMVSQIDAGYLDENTTLVTLSIGGNDMKFAGVISACVGTALLLPGQDTCSGATVAGDSQPILAASAVRLADELPSSLAAVVSAVRARAPHAAIVLLGYPKLFEWSGGCIIISDSNKGWLNDLSDDIQSVIDNAAAAADTPTARVVAVNPQAAFGGHNLCVMSGSGINGIEFGLTRGEPATFAVGDFRILSTAGVASQTSVHPNSLGTGYYAAALEDALDDIYP